MGVFALRQQTDYRKRLSLETMLQDLYNDENKAVFDLGGGLYLDHMASVR
jgi:hypothetical protein